MNVNAELVTTELQQLFDRNEITDLVYRLGVCLDEGHLDDMRSLFVPEATARTPGGTANGRETVVAQAERNHKPEDRIQHTITNLLVDIEGDLAKVRANLVVRFAPPAATHQPALAPPVEFTLGEVYHFDVVRTAQGWRFAHIETIPVWMSGSRDRTPTE